MKRYLLLLSAVLVVCSVSAQKTLMFEKIGTLKKYYYHTGDPIRLRALKQDTLLKGRVWAISDSMVSVTGMRPVDLRLNEINTFYQRFYFPRKLSRYLIPGSLGIFSIIVVDHLLNHEQVFTSDLFIISGSVLGGGLLTFSLSQKKHRIGYRWKVKVLDAEIW